MAEVIGGKTIHELKFEHGKRAKWLKWLDGQVWRLKRGDDFTVECAAARTCLYMAQRRSIGMDFIVRTVVMDRTPGREVLAVQLCKRDAA